MIEVDHVTKSFDRFVAVNDLSFTVAAGEVLGFLGPNGAGKSTTMKMITGYMAPSQGHIRIFGQDINQHARAIKRQIGYLPEGAPLYGDMTPLQLLNFVIKVRSIPKNIAQDRMQHIIQRLSLQDALDQPIHTLSKGFKRRVGLAQALIHDPQLLILDEPTDGLDPNQKHEVRELIRNLASDKIVIISTHILEEVAAVCTRALIIRRGQQCFDGTPHELEAKSRYHGAIRAVYEQPVTSQQLMQLPNVASVEAIDSENKTFVLFSKSGPFDFVHMQQAMQNTKVTPSQISMERGRLDDVFRSLTAAS
ncbi:MAG: ABC transporter ATP-binding protein [Pseudomonadota bacterium]